MCTGSGRGFFRAASAAALVALVAGAVTFAHEQPERYAGRTLAAALQLLQQRGLRIVYSSIVVTDAMRVSVEPRAGDARRTLEELLRPHGLEAKPGPGGVLQIVRAPQIAPRAPRTSDGKSTQRGDERDARNTDQSASRSAQAPPSYDEAVIVLASADERRDLGVASQSDLDRNGLRLRSGVFANDPLRAVQTLPRVAASDDFRGEFSIRGSASRHLGVVIDGVATPYLQHAAYGVADSGSLAMLNPDVVERAALQVGAYPRRFEDTLGGQLALTVREGSRNRTTASGSLAGLAAAIVAEGPLGPALLQVGDAHAGQRRGSWLVSGRQSFLDWPTTRFGGEYAGMGFGFRDIQAKAVYDATATEQFSFTAVSGQSMADYGNDATIDGVVDGAHRATVATAGWRSTLGSATVLSQRAHIVTHAARNRGPGARLVSAGHERELSYRAELVRAWPRVVLETAGALQQVRGSLVASDLTFTTSAWERSGYVHTAWTAAPGLTIAPGIRIASSTLASRAAATPWILGEWAWAPGWTLTASAGLGHQFPGIDDVLSLSRRSSESMTVAKADSRRSTEPMAGAKADDRLLPERARYVDVALDRSIAKDIRLQATLFDRAERDVIDGGRNRLTGTSRGVELLVERVAPAGLSATASYSFGRARYHDRLTGERFWADFDQRHAVNLFLSYRFSRASLAAALRSGSNFPIAGYVSSRGGSLFSSDQRNDARRPPYARLDVQASRTLAIAGRDVVLYLEMLNVLNRTNFGPARGIILADGEAVGFTEKLLPRFVSGGLRIEF